MEIAFHCPNCLADLIYDESKKYTCCFCHTVLDEKNEVKELEGGYYVGDAWNDKVYHSLHCEDCGADFIAKPGTGCPICSSTSLKDNGGIVGAMPRRAIPFAHTRQEAQEMFLDYIRNNSAVGRTLATDENKELLHKVYVPIWLFTYEVVAHAKLTAMIRNKANESKTLFGINGTEGIAESLSEIRSSFSRFRPAKKNQKVDPSTQPSEHVTGGVLSWQGIPFDASGILASNTMNNIQPYDQSKMVLLNDKVLMDTPVLAITKDPIACMQEFMDRIKKWTRQMIMDAHSDSYDISYFQDKTDYPLGIGELVLFPIWYMKGEYMGREFFYAMNGQNGEVEANIPMSKGSSKNAGITYQQYWDKSRCTALNDTHFEFNIHDPSIEILDYSFFEKPKESRVTPKGRLDPVASKERKSLDSVFETSADEPKEDQPKEKKKFSDMNLEVGFKRRNPDEKLTKEEEMQREREMIARLAVAAKEAPKGDMAAAASVPSWAKAVTPPPSQTQTPTRAARTKKPGASAASAANKPLWEKTEEEIRAEKEATRSTATSMASHMARGQEVSPFAANPALDASNMELEDLDKMPPVMDPSSLYMKVPDKYKTPAPSEEPEEKVEEKVFREQIASTSSRDDFEIPESYEIPMPKISKERKPKPAFKPEPEPESLVEEAPVFKPAPIIDEPVVEEPAAEEVPTEEMVANITFSFNKKKPIMDSEERVTEATSIPRQIEKAPEEKLGMAIMNSEYDAGVLNNARTEANYEVDEAEPREILPKSQLNATEYYRGSEENDRPLKYRPAAPLAHARSNLNLEPVDRVDLAPEDDETNRPLAYRPPAPLARATEQGPSLEYMTEQPLDEDIHQMPSLDAQKPRWGEMPEAKETPSWAKPQEDTSSPFAGHPRNRGRSFLSKDELRAAEEEAQRRASNAANTSRRPMTLAERRRMEAEEGIQKGEGVINRNNGPRTLARSARDDAEMRAASAARTSTGPRTLSEKSDEEAAAQAASVFHHPARRPADEDETPAIMRQAMMRPAARVEEPEEEEERPAIFKPAPSASRPASSATRPAARPTERPAGRPAGRPGSFRGSARSEEEEAPAPKEKSVPIWERVPDTDGPVPAWGSAARVDDDRPLGSLTKPKDLIIDVEKPRERPSLWGPSSGDTKEVLPGALRDAEARESRSSVVPRAREVEIERPAAREILPERPAREIEARPRTFAQRRAMEEEERRRQMQSAFKPAEEEDDQPINKTFESTQFENKPSVVASLDMLPEPLGEESIHHLAKDRSVPALAHETNQIEEELEQAEKTAEKAMRGLPGFDPEGPSPFKPNR